jgi:hypothetical protein
MELCGLQAKARRPAARKAPSALKNARHSLRTKNTARNTAGVSLIAIAIPVSTPRPRLGLSQRISTTTSAVSKILTCPKLKVSVIGSVSIAAKSAQPAQPGQRKARRTRATQPQSAAKEAIDMRMLAAVRGIQLNGTKSSAANGG